MNEEMLREAKLLSCRKILLTMNYPSLLAHLILYTGGRELRK